MDSNSVLRGFKLNKKQRLVLAIFIPIIIFFIALTIAYDTGVTPREKQLSIHSPRYYARFPLEPKPSPNYTTTTHDPFDWGKTWYVWMFYLIFCGIFEYKLFEDKKKKDK
jgi:hypothetical protein